MIRSATYARAALSAALVACTGATEPAATVPAVDGSYRFQIAVDSIAPTQGAYTGTGTITLRRVGPVLRDSVTGRRYQRLDGAVVYDGAPAADALNLGPSDQWPQYRSLVDETGAVTLGAFTAGGAMLAFHAELAPAGAGRLAGAFHDLVPATHVYFRDGTMSAERQP